MLDQCHLVHYPSHGFQKKKSSLVLCFTGGNQTGLERHAGASE